MADKRRGYIENGKLVVLADINGSITPCEVVGGPIWRAWCKKLKDEGVPVGEGDRIVAHGWDGPVRIITRDCHICDGKGTFCSGPCRGDGVIVTIAREDTAPSDDGERAE